MKKPRPQAGKMVNKGAIRRQRRKTDAAQAQAKRAEQVQGPQMGGLYTGTPVDSKNVRISRCGTGLCIGRGGYVRADGLILEDNNVGIENEGRFDGPDTIVK